MNRMLLGIAASLVLGFACTACSSASATNGGPDAASESVGHDGGEGCPGVCGTVTGAVCASTFQTSACLGGSCCILAADSGPPYFDDAGTCPGSCLSPDDTSCLSWYRSSMCASGDLCCMAGGAGGDGGDAGSEGGGDAKTD